MSLINCRDLCSKNQLRDAYNERAHHPLSYDRESEMLIECNTCVRMVVELAKEAQRNSEQAQRLQKQQQEYYKWANTSVADLVAQHE